MMIEEEGGRMPIRAQETEQENANAMMMEFDRAAVVWARALASFFIRRHMNVECSEGGGMTYASIISILYSHLRDDDEDREIVRARRARRRKEEGKDSKGHMGGGVMNKEQWDCVDRFLRCRVERMGEDAANVVSMV